MANSQRFVPYLQSMSNELNSIRDRVRQLVTHWPSDGHFKESVLRQFLRRHLPESVTIGTGFVVNAERASGEIDILVVDRNMPTLFKEGELLIVTPDSVNAVIEVKTSLASPAKIKEAILQIAERKAAATMHVETQDVWAGLFVYDGEGDRHEEILSALRDARDMTDVIVDCVAYGSSAVVRYFRKSAASGGQWPDHAWHTFHCPGLAPSNFVASLIEHIAPPNRDPGAFVWFQVPDSYERRYIMKDESGAAISPFDEWIRDNPHPMIRHFQRIDRPSDEQTDE